MWFCGAHVAAMCGGDKDRATGVASLTNEEPLMVMESSIDIVWKVVREDGSYGCNSVVGKGKAPLRRGGSRSIHEGAFGTENGDVSCDWVLRFAPFLTPLPADHATLDDYGTALTHGILPGIPF